MTEDPVKLYVVVMSILLCVLGFVAWSSYQDAEAFAKALERAPRDADELTELATDVQQLCDQLGQSKMKEGPLTLVESTGNRLGIKASSLKTDKRRIGRGIRGKERIVKFDFGGGRKSPPQPRVAIAQFCQAVERDSQGILKTIDLTLRRKTGKGLPAAGEKEKVLDDAYGGTIVFGVRVVE